LRERPIGFNLLPKKFTLKQLQSLYEVILDIDLDKRNFRRKLKSLNLLMELEELQENVAHRPARLYKFDYESYNERLAKDGLSFEL
jgi:8-oxo-dGTP diphosphatase